MNKIKPACSKTALMMAQVESALSSYRMTATQLATSLVWDKNSVMRTIAKLREERKIRVCGYSENFAMIFECGSDPDALRPEAKVYVSKQRIRRESKIVESKPVACIKFDPYALPAEFFRCSRAQA